MPETYFIIPQAKHDALVTKAYLKRGYDAAEAAGAHGLSNFLAERQDAHVKHGWMLRATSKG